MPELGVLRSFRVTCTCGTWYARTRITQELLQLIVKHGAETMTIGTIQCAFCRAIAIIPAEAFFDAMPKLQAVPPTELRHP